ncbi:M56 family metallopeptidase [Aurantiacibacter gilvus]|uniref:M56 family metallopeptidase n=1 Tax=Aurantiacibacter gilvus TaxID=3139141 RepID=A0ABU9IDH5_9SPHN
MSGMADWLVDTFIYTGVLIALVLVLRRPVSRHFGPQVAYALWALPFLRFIMPPLVLPAWMAPEEPVAEAATGTEPMMFIISDPATAAGTAGAFVPPPPVGLSVTDLLLPLWLGGALLFLGWRVREYYRMRAELLAESVPVGEAGKVRLVETPAVSGPVAFGVFDKVVALPPAFMAHYDITARDMAIAHELAHHRGYDLIANIAAQPLLALHWFNPLAWWGWRAMRRDQEAACDARVVAGREQEERVAYAEVIAGFAAGEHMALAAPMACPVLGEKSIIHRLRSLTMSEVSSRRRRFGIAAITTTALALPLTASITYAQGETPQEEQVIETVDPDGEEQHRVVRIERRAESDAEDGERHVEVHVIRDEGVEAGEDGHRRIVRRIHRNGEHEMSEAEFEAMMAELEAELEGMDGQIEAAIEIAMETARHAEGIAGHRVVFADEEAGLHELDVSCDDSGETVIERDLGNGRRAMVICRAAIRAEAAAGLREAREQIANDRELPAELREEILRSLDESLQEMSARQATQDRLQAKVHASERTANARASAVAMRWSGRMVTPVAAAAPPAPVAAVHWEVSAPAGAGWEVRSVAPVAPVTPVAPLHPDADCDDEVTRA